MGYLFCRFAYLFTSFSYQNLVWDVRLVASLNVYVWYVSIYTYETSLAHVEHL